MINQNRNSQHHQFVVKNGRLQPRQETTNINQENYRLIPYNHTIRVIQDDYATVTIKQQKQQLQKLRSIHQQLQQQYQQLVNKKNKQSKHQEKSIQLSIAHQYHINHSYQNGFEDYGSIGELLIQLENAKYRLKVLDEFEGTASSFHNQPLQKELSQSQFDFQSELLDALSEIDALRQELHKATITNEEFQKLTEEKEQLKKSIKILQQKLSEQKQNNAQLQIKVTNLEGCVETQNQAIQQLIGLCQQLQQSEVIIKKYNL